MEQAFRRWGMPRRIKIDNGYPFINPRAGVIQSLIVLWWVGLGIEVTLNRPGTPQQNGTVEGLQGISYRWVNPALYASPGELQVAMNEIVRRQMQTYRMTRKKYKTRLELYPELESNPRVYDPSAFSIQRVKEYLAQIVLERVISPNGKIKIVACRLYVGYKRKGQSVTVTFDLPRDAWVIRSVTGKELLVSPEPVITAEHILNLIPISKNL